MGWDAQLEAQPVANESTDRTIHQYFAKSLLGFKRLPQCRGRRTPATCREICTSAAKLEARKQAYQESTYPSSYLSKYQSIRKSGNRCLSVNTGAGWWLGLGLAWAASSWVDTALECSIVLGFYVAPSTQHPALSAQHLAQKSS